MPEKVSTSTNEMLWDVETDKEVIKEIKEKDGRKWYFVDVTVLQDHHVVMKQNEKTDKHLELAKKARTENQMKVVIIPIIIGAMGKTPKRLKNHISTLGIPDTIGSAQTSVLIGTKKILRNVLSL